MRSVALVLNEAYEGDLRDLAFRGAVWLIDSESNRARAEELWLAAAEWPQISVTVIRTEAHPSRQDWLQIIAQIDLHHGPVSQRVPYDTLEVIGAELTKDAREALLESGFPIFESTAEGFRATRQSAAARP